MKNENHIITKQYITIVDFTGNQTNLNGEELQYFVQDSQAVGGVTAVGRKPMHPLYLLLNRRRFLFSPHLLPPPSLFRTLQHGSCKLWIHLCTIPCRIIQFPPNTSAANLLNSFVLISWEKNKLVNFELTGNINNYW